MNFKKNKKITITDLMEYNGLSNILLKKNPLKKKKNKKEVLREFNKEKWGNLLKYFEKKNFSTIKEIDKFFYGNSNKMFPIWNNKSFILDDIQGAIKKQNNIFYNILKKFSYNIDSFIELGAGYGSNFFKLAQKKPFKKLRLSASDISLNGVELMKKISNKIEIRADIGYCDIYNGKSKDFLSHRNSLIYTSYAMHYKKYLNSRFVEFILSLNPRYVVHFEPIYEHMQGNSAHANYCGKYMKYNDYTLNFLSILKKCEKDRMIKIIYEDKMVFGINPLLPLSVIVWKKYK